MACVCTGGAERLSLFAALQWELYGSGTFNSYSGCGAVEHHRIEKIFEIGYNLCGKKNWKTSWSRRKVGDNIKNSAAILDMNRGNF